MVIQPTERRYAPPKHDEIHPPVAGRRNKDDLHEWSIYRQNLTSSIADGMLQPPGVMPSPGSEVCPTLITGIATFSIRGVAIGGHVLDVQKMCRRVSQRPLKKSSPH